MYEKKRREVYIQLAIIKGSTKGLVMWTKNFIIRKYAYAQKVTVSDYRGHKHRITVNVKSALSKPCAKISLSLQ